MLNDLPIYDHLAAQRNLQTMRRKFFPARDDIAPPARMDNSAADICSTMPSSVRTTLRLRSRPRADRSPGGASCLLFRNRWMRGCVVTQWLNILVFLVGQLVTRNIELQRSAERDIQYLNAFANAENRQTARERFETASNSQRSRTGSTSLSIKRRIDNFLAQKFRRNIGAARQQQSVHLVHGNVVCCAHSQTWTSGCLAKNGSKPFFVLWSNPGRQIGHRRICDFPPRM